MYLLLILEYHALRENQRRKLMRALRIEVRRNTVFARLVDERKRVVGHLANLGEFAQHLGSIARLVVSLPRIIQEHVVGSNFAKLGYPDGRVFEVKAQVLDPDRIIESAHLVFARIGGLAGQPARNADHGWLKPRVGEHLSVDVGERIPGFEIEAEKDNANRAT